MTSVERPLFDTVAVLGLGLLGGSVALATRRFGVARRLVAAGRRRAPLERARADGIVDEIGDARDIVADADLVILATPVGSMPRVLEQAARSLRPGTVVTDVGSVKACLVDTLPGLLPVGVEYIGSHPMSGSHLRGVEHARSDLFEGACCVVTPHAGSDADACERVELFWRRLGARVVQRDPVRHDEEVAWTSHAPHVLAFAFAHALAAAPEGAGELAAGGFRDFTRIAASDAELWGDILSANRKALAGPLEAFGESLRALARAIEEGDGDAQEDYLTRARSTLTSVRELAFRDAPASGSAPAFENTKAPQCARSGGENPEIQSRPSDGTPRK